MLYLTRLPTLSPPQLELSWTGDPAGSRHLVKYRTLTPLGALSLSSTEEVMSYWNELLDIVVDMRKDKWFHLVLILDEGHNVGWIWSQNTNGGASDQWGKFLVRFGNFASDSEDNVHRMILNETTDLAQWRIVVF